MEYFKEKGFTQHYFSKKEKSNAGFTIIETFVAISILLASITGPIVLVSKSIQSAAFAKQRLTATYLALEGIELVRWKRDNNLLDPDEATDWLDNIDQCIGTKCSAIGIGNVLSACTGDCPVLQRNTENGQYSYGESGDEWVDTIYMREITVNTINAVEVEVESKVFWQPSIAGGVKEVLIKDYLFDAF